MQILASVGLVALLLLQSFCFGQIEIKTNATDPYYVYNSDQRGWVIGTQSNPIQVTNNLPHVEVPSVYKDFVNQTLLRKPLGVCQKEVPTASLFDGDASVPRGNGSNPTLSRITVCCNGYQRNEHIYRKCEPICETGCMNGICYAPNECICYPNHVKNLADFCVPTCPIGCSDGQCNGNTCVCKEGYTLDKTHKFCVPVCNPPCGKGNCTAPNTCSCNNGYESGANGHCIPKCKNGCEFGECVAPEKCACRAGYLLQEAKCTPVCSKGCINGRCSAPNTCSCNEGWTLDPSGTRCDAKCDQPCLNGLCDGPNKCNCHPGYRVDSTDPFRCNAHCPEPCVNGVCSSPEFCICNAGFIKDRSVKGSQLCIPRV